eukprot:257766_1
MLSLWLLLVWIKEAQSLTLQDINDLLITSGNIGWLKVTQCTSSKWIYEPPFTDVNSVVDLLPHAISFKLVPVDNAEIQVSDFELEAVICSNPIWNLNHAKELSFTTDMNTGLVIGYEDYDNWIGTDTAKGRLVNTQWGSGCPVVGEAPRDFRSKVYDCCGCDTGLNVLLGSFGSFCQWANEAPNSYTLYNPEMMLWLGFDTNLSAFCQEDGNGNYVLTTATTLPPSTNPSNTPSANPTKRPSVDPSGTPSSNPSKTPSANPTKRPSVDPSGTPSSNPSTPSVNPSATLSSNPTLTPILTTHYPTQYLSSNPSFHPSTNPSQYPLSGPPEYSSIPSTDSLSNTEPYTEDPSMGFMQNNWEYVVVICVVLLILCTVIVLVLVFIVMPKKTEADEAGTQISKAVIKMHDALEGNGQTPHAKSEQKRVEDECGDESSSSHGLYHPGASSGGETTNRATTEGDTMHQRCSDCGKQHCRQIYERDGLFYCKKCFVYRYGGTTTNAGTNTAGEATAK